MPEGWLCRPQSVRCAGESRAPDRFVWWFRFRRVIENTPTGATCFNTGRNGAVMCVFSFRAEEQKSSVVRRGSLDLKIPKAAPQSFRNRDAIFHWCALNAVIGLKARKRILISCKLCRFASPRAALDFDPRDMEFESVTRLAMFVDIR